MKNFLILLCILVIQSCSTAVLENLGLQRSFQDEMITQSEASNEYNTPTVQLNKTKEILDASTITFPTLTATGYAVVSSQPGQSIEQKRLMAIRAARMAAIRELAEQIHGLKVDSNTTVIDLMVQNDTFRGIVTGVIRGARTVRINPTGADTYETVLEIDQDMVAYLFRQAQSL